jgi:hypothetical protein
MYYIWEIGKTLEDYNQKLTISALGRENIVGHFTCLCGTHSYSGSMLPDADTPTCSKCGTKVDRYSELKLSIGALVGSPDMLANYTGYGYNVTEYKSIKVDSFKELTAPDPHHETQALTYVAMLNHLVRTKPESLDNLGLDAADLDLDSAVIIYSAKDYLGYALPIKVFETKWSTLNQHKKQQILDIINTYGNLESSDDAINLQGICYDESGTVVNQKCYETCPLASICKQHKEECNNSSYC